MKKLLISLFILIFLAVAGGVGALYYIRPDIELTLDYQPVRLKDKALDMVKRMSFEMILSEGDVNNVLKKSLAQNPRSNPDIEVRGANFTLAGDRLIADFNLMWKNRVPAGVQVTYRLAWHDPYLTATVERVKLKDFTLPRNLVKDMELPVGRELPKLLKIEEIRFTGKELAVKLKKPGLKDLQQLIG